MKKILNQSITKKYVAFSTMLLLAYLSGIISPAFAQWPKYVIDNENISEAVTVDAADFNGDTRPDLVVTNILGNQLIVYQNNYPDWIKHIVEDDDTEYALQIVNDFEETVIWIL